MSGKTKSPTFWSSNPTPFVGMDIFATGEEPYVDPTQMPGYFPLFARKVPSGTYDYSVGMFWDKEISYSQMSIGTELIVNTHKALQCETRLFGDGHRTLTDEIASIMKNTGGIFFDDIARNAAGNMARAKRLAEEATGDFLSTVVPPNAPVNHVVDLLVGPFEDWFNNLRIRWSTLHRGSFATAGLALAPIGAKVGKKLPSTRIEYPFQGTNKKYVWNFSADNLTLDDKKAVKDVAISYFFTLGALGYPDVIQNDWAEHWSIKHALLLEKFLRLGLEPTLQGLGTAIQLTMPFVLRPCFHDLQSHSERTRLITFLAGLLMSVAECRKDGVNTLITPSQFTGSPNKDKIPEELVRECFNGSFLAEQPYSGNSVTLIRPEKGIPSSLELMVGKATAASNTLEPETWLRKASIDWTPHVMTSDVMALANAPEWLQYKVVGFGYRGKVLHLWADLANKAPDTIRIIDEERRTQLKGNVHGDLNSITSMLLFGSTPIWTANTGQFISQIGFSNIPSGLGIGTRQGFNPPGLAELQAQEAIAEIAKKQHHFGDE